MLSSNQIIPNNNIMQGNFQYPM